MSESNSWTTPPRVLSVDDEAVVCENLSLENEKIFRGTLENIAIKEITWLSILVVKNI